MSVTQRSRSPLDGAQIGTLAELPARMVWIRMRRCASDYELAAYLKEDLVFRLAGDGTA